MKKAAILMSLMVFGIAHGGWIWKNDYHPHVPTKIYFADPQHGWIWNEPLRILYYSSDSGKTWNIGSEGNGNSIYDIFSVGRDTVWAVGSNSDISGNVVFKSTDGGSTWNIVFESLQSLQSPYARPRINKIMFPTSTDGYFFGRANRCSNCDDHLMIGKTKDGGENWSVEVFDSLRIARDVFFINADTGWVAVDTLGHLGLKPRILRTVDGGNTWEHLKNLRSDQPVINTIFFIDSKRGWRGGGWNSSVEYTEDGGITWNVIGDPYGDIKRIHFVNNSVGWLLTDNRLYSTLDGGKEWEEYNEHGYITSADMCFVGSNYGWVVTQYWDIFRTTDYGGLPNVSVNPQSSQKQITSTFNMRVSPAKSGKSKIIYTLNKESTLTISVYNLKGKRVAFQPKRLRTAGEHTFSFKASKGFYILEANVRDKSGSVERMFSERVLVK